VRGERIGTLCRTKVEVGHDIHGGETDLARLMWELGEDTSVVEARREIGGQGRKLTMEVVKSWWGCRKRCQAGTIKVHLRYDTPVSVGILSAAALRVDRRRGRGFRLGVTGDNGVARSEEIHRW
jgi:hypothetical protein